MKVVSSESIPLAGQLSTIRSRQLRIVLVWFDAGIVDLTNMEWIWQDFRFVVMSSPRHSSVRCILPKIHGRSLPHSSWAHQRTRLTPVHWSNSQYVWLPIGCWWLSVVQWGTTVLIRKIKNIFLTWCAAVVPESCQIYVHSNLISKFLSLLVELGNRVSDCVSCVQPSSHTRVSCTCKSVGWKPTDLQIHGISVSTSR